MTRIAAVTQRGSGRRRFARRNHDLRGACAPGMHVWLGMELGRLRIRAGATFMACPPPHQFSEITRQFSDSLQMKRKEKTMNTRKTRIAIFARFRVCAGFRGGANQAHRNARRRHDLKPFEPTGVESNTSDASSGVSKSGC